MGLTILAATFLIVCLLPVLVAIDPATISGRNLTPYQRRKARESRDHAVIKLAELALDILVSIISGGRSSSSGGFRGGGGSSGGGGASGRW